MKPVLLAAASLTLCFMLAGCPTNAPESSSAPAAADTSKSDTAAPAAEADDAEVVTAIQSFAKGIKQDGDGYVVEVDLRDSEPTAEQLQQLTGLKKLKSLLLNNAKMSDASLEPVGKLTALANLDLRGCSIGNDGLAHLTALTNLRALRLSGESGACSVDDAGLEHIGKLTGLKSLPLDFLWIGGEGLAKLAGLKQLEELYLAGTLVGDEDLVQLKHFPGLKKLRISKLSQITGAGLSEVAKLQHLENLDLSEDSSLADDDLAHLEKLTTLTRLNLWRVPLTDAGAKHLAGLTNLQWLNLDNTQLTDAGIDSLQQMQRLTFLHLGSTAVSDAGMPKLAGLKSLEHLEVTRTAVTEKGVAELQKELPKTKIQLKYLGSGE